MSPPLSSTDQSFSQADSVGKLATGEITGEIAGEVMIHPSAVIAADVVIQADRGSQIWIGAGVCIGRGAILHADRGLLTLADNVTIGAGVLIVGSGEIGVQACIGPMTTLFNCAVAPGSIIAPGSILGDGSRRLDPAARAGQNGSHSNGPTNGHTKGTSNSHTNGHSNGHTANQTSQNDASGMVDPWESQPPTSTAAPAPATDSLARMVPRPDYRQVYGQAQLEALLSSLRA
jgi:carbon dioxide concentrating mechanism protein CcmN